MRPLDLEGPDKPGPGTITNRETGATLHGVLRAHHSTEQFRFAIDGATRGNVFVRKDWTFTPDPEPVKDGYYLHSGLVYRISGNRVTAVNMKLEGDAVIVSRGTPQIIAEAGVFMGDLEGNR